MKAVRWFLLAAVAACVSASSEPDFDKGVGKIATLRVTPESLTVNAGDIAQARCIPLTQRGDSLKNVCTWKSTDTTVVRVTSGSQTSTLTARRNGVVTVTASAGGKSASLKVTVADGAPPPPPPDTTPPPPPPPPPPTGCSGIAVAVGASLQSAVNANGTGVTFCLAPGTWTQQSVVPKASQRFIGARDANGARLSILDGQNATVSAFSGSAATVRIEGLIVRNYFGGTGTGTTQLSVAIFPNGATGWVIIDNEVGPNTGAGIAITNGATVRRNNVHHNGWLGMSCGGGNGAGAVVDSNEVSWNNTRGIDPNWGAGGIKCVPAPDVTFRANHVTHNAGYGIWCDNCGGTTRYLDNRVDSNSHSGIYHEVSGGAVISGNTLLGNGASNRGGIWVDNSGPVEIMGNTVGSAPNGAILLRQVSRPDLPGRVLQNVSVHDNTVTLGAGSLGLVQYVGDNNFFTGKGNHFDRNTYQSASGPPFRWNNANLTWTQWRAAGQDTDPASSFTP